jgi:hypothetical protein
MSRRREQWSLIRGIGGNEPDTERLLDISVGS